MTNLRNTECKFKVGDTKSVLSHYWVDPPAAGSVCALLRSTQIISTNKNLDLPRSSPQAKTYIYPDHLHKQKLISTQIISTNKNLDLLTSSAQTKMPDSEFFLGSLSYSAFDNSSE